MSLAFIPSDFTHGEYTFRRATPADAARVRGWMQADHMRNWWMPDEGELSLALANDRGRAAYIVSHGGLAFAFIYVVDPAHDPLLGEALDYPAGTIRFEQFVGDADMIGHGHGVGFVKAFVGAVRTMPGLSRLLTLPLKENVFAQRTYTQCGLRSRQGAPESLSAYLLMVLDLAR